MIGKDPTAKSSASPAPIPERIQKIRSRLPQAMLRDQAAISRSLGRLLQKSGIKFKEDGRSLKQMVRLSPAQTRWFNYDLSSLEHRLEHSIRERNSRSSNRPRLHFPAALPITAKRREIVRSITENPVVIISGETGCGKSTQIPKMCLEAGRGIAGKIACTQPRRIAAITIAHRIAEELGETVGRSVGYKIRFDDKTAPDAYIKIMTDGMLLAETQSDRGFYAYDTLIIDEAHERSLNIDFLLGIARTLLAGRPELKVIITSATLDTEKFSRAFGDAPVIHVGGRMYPVDVEYMPPDVFSDDTEEGDYVDMAVQAVERIAPKKRPGDILIFMPTEQDILETCERLEGKKYPATTILPLYARLPASEQGRVYSVTGPKIVVATNVAETSLTIPNIKYVIDTGLARISQYQPGTRINSLPISPVSQASADQRKGRCGRVQEGLCIRLYSEEEFGSRMPFTPPEILRSNLAEVILRMLFLGLGHPSDFPFIDRPHPKNIRDGFDTLLELGAVAGKGRDYELTPLGRQMALMPLDPKISRILLEARQEECLGEVAVIAAVLSIRDPRERPLDKAGLVDQAQASFAHPDSDFLTFLNIWNRFHSPTENLSSRSKKKAFCHEHFLSYARMREWEFVLDQIMSILKEQGISPDRTEKAELSASRYAGIHRSILSGFLSNIAVHKEKNIYTAARGREIMVFPGSALFNKSRPWIVAAEIVRTSRLFGRTAAKIDPAWLEGLAGNACRYSYSEPRWDKDRGEVRAKERATLYGLEIVAGRDVPYGPKNPGEAHNIFVRNGLVEGEVKEPPPFLQHNLSLQKRILSLEDKLRRRDIMVREEDIADFYSARLAGIYDLRGLEKRIRQMGGHDFLRMGEKDLIFSRPEGSELALYPDEVAVGGRLFQASYKFAPGEDDDGMTLHIPSAQVESVPAEALEWGAPGYFKDKTAALIKGLPKRYRKLLMPVSETAAIIVKEIRQADRSLFEALTKFVRQRFHADIPAEEWAKADIPKHLKVRVAITDQAGRILAAGRDLDEIKRVASTSTIPEDSEEWRQAKKSWEKTGLISWDFGDLPESIAVAPFTTAYPALEPTEGGVNLRLLTNREEALSAHVKAIERMLLLRFSKDLEFVRQYLVLPEEYEKAALYFGGKSTLEKSMLGHLRRDVFQKNLRTRKEFDAHAETVVRTLFERGHTLKETVLGILDAYGKARRRLQAIETSAISNRGAAAICRQVEEDLEALLPKNFLEIYSLDRLSHFPRYLRALEVRAERGKNDPEKDRKKADEVRPFLEVQRRLEQGIRAETSLEKKKAIEGFRWMIGEFKVSLFAPELKTAFPVSAKRLAVKAKEIDAMS